MQPIYFDSNILKKTDAPVRVHRKNRWMSEAYHKRIQKKWIKRFGYLMEPAIVRSQNVIFAHPSFASILQQQTGQRNDPPTLHY